MIETWNMGKVVPVGITSLLFSVRNVIRNVDHYHWGIPLTQACMSWHAKVLLRCEKMFFANNSHGFD